MFPYSTFNNVVYLISGGRGWIRVLCKEAAGDTVLSPKLLRWVRQCRSHDECRWDPDVLIPGTQLIRFWFKSVPLRKYCKTLNNIFVLMYFPTFGRFSNRQTRSCFMVVEGVWALVARSLRPGKLRNDSRSLPLTCKPSLLPSLPLFSFLSPNSQKSNLYPGLFSFFICTS